MRCPEFSLVATIAVASGISSGYVLRVSVDCCQKACLRGLPWVCEARGQKTLAGAPYIRVAHCGFSAVSPLTLEHWFISLVLNVGQTGQRPVSFYLSIQSAVRHVGNFKWNLSRASGQYLLYVNSKYFVYVDNLNGTF